MPAQQMMEIFQSTLDKTHEWLTELCDRGPFRDEAQAYSGLRAVLHALRDRLNIDEASHLAAQLPQLIRGVYYEGWKPSATPTRQRSLEEFLQTVQANHLDRLDVDPREATEAVFALLRRKVVGGEIDDVRGVMPAEIRELWGDDDGR